MGMMETLLGNMGFGIKTLMYKSGESSPLKDQIVKLAIEKDAIGKVHTLMERAADNEQLQTILTMLKEMH